LKKVLILGAGLVTKPGVRYLLDNNLKVTVASRTVSKAENLIAEHENGAALQLLATETDKMEKLIEEHDLVVSLLPYTYHVQVAKLAIKHKTPMVTTSYVSQAMKDLDEEAKAAGVLILNELGVDPGIDHMSAMRIIDAVKEKGGKITHFKSYCGGLPAPEANDVPWGYKFSWSPLGVIMAGKNSARFLEEGKQVDVPGSELFSHHWEVDVENKDIGSLEGYPNRDCLGYIELYGLEGIKTMFRGTLRYPGWSVCMKNTADFGYLDDKEIETKGMTYAQLTEKLLDEGEGDIRQRAADKIGIAVDSDTLNRWEWLGLFGDEKIAHETCSPMVAFADIMLKKLPYKEDERDMIVLFHEFYAEYPDHKERLTSTLIDFGIPNGDSSMSRTVSLPAAVAVRRTLAGEFDGFTGVHIPVHPNIYRQILDELEGLDIICKEKTEIL